MKTTTLKEIRKYKPCKDGWKKLLTPLSASPTDELTVSFKTILESNGIEDAIWCLRTLPFEEQRLFRADVAQSVLHIFENKYPNDDRPRKAIEALRNLDIADLEPYRKDAADAAADAAASAAYAADYAAAAAAYAADAAASAAYAADYAAAAIRKNKWEEIETIFIKHYY